MLRSLQQAKMTLRVRRHFFHLAFYVQHFGAPCQSIVEVRFALLDGLPHRLGDGRLPLDEVEGEALGASSGEVDELEKSGGDVLALRWADGKVSSCSEREARWAKRTKTLPMCVLPSCTLPVPGSSLRAPGRKMVHSNEERLTRSRSALSLAS